MFNNENTVKTAHLRYLFGKILYLTSFSFLTSTLGHPRNFPRKFHQKDLR